MSGWVDTDLAGLRKNSSLAKVISEMLQNALDTDAGTITLNITPDGRGLGKVIVTDDDPNGYVNLRDAYTLFAPSTKGADDTKRGIFNVGEKEFLAFCVEGQIVTTSGTVVFHKDRTRTTGRRKIPVGSLHDFTMRMGRDDQAAMIARLREVILDGKASVSVNGVELPVRPALLETSIELPLMVASKDDPYRFTVRPKATRITLHEAAGGGPTLHVLGMPVQEIECPYSINVHGRLKLDQARDQVTAPTLAKVMAAAANMLAEADKLTDEDAQSWAGDTLGPTSTPIAVKAIIDGKFGPDAMVASVTDHGANADAASFGRPLIHSRSLRPEARDALRRAQTEHPDLAPVTTAQFASPVEGLLTQQIPEAEWHADAQRVVAWARAAFAVCFPGDTLTVSIYGGDKANHCIAAGSRNELIFNQGLIGWEWFERSNNAEIIDTVIHEFGHHAKHMADHSPAWGYACCSIAGKLLLWGQLP
jgi:hypothetical protein